MTWPYEFSVGDLMRRAAETPSEVAKRERLTELALYRDLHREVYGGVTNRRAKLSTGFPRRFPQPRP